MTLLLGCIGDDHTGSTDLANTLVKNGMRTVQVIGMPAPGASVPEAEAIVVALKSRTTPAEDAVAESLAAARWLAKAGARQFFFKYCSTFDSTDKGNIGPVTEALMAELDADLAIACPAFPTNGRTLYKGYLFVFGDLLSESSMRNHPLTPMTDANLVRVLQRQTAHPVGLVDYGDVARGPAAIEAALKTRKRDGKRMVIVDAVSDEHLYAIGTACAGMKLVTGGSGVACGLPENFRRAGLIPADTGQAAQLPDIAGTEAIIAGSCSTATLAQLAHAERANPLFRIDPARVMAAEDVAGAALDWAADKLGRSRPIFAASADPKSVAIAQQHFGRMEVGEMLERTLAAIATGLVGQGVRRLVVAGGETSGAVVQSLGITRLRIGPEIDPGVPWCESLDEAKLAIALKSGNFGGEDFFTKAFAMLPGGKP
ncbi:MAG: 3-oxo-tetronate kinase [Rhodospirillaceae bacterium]